MCSFAKTAGRCGGKSLLVLPIDTLRRHIFRNFPAEFDFCFCDSTDLQMSCHFNLVFFQMGRRLLLACFIRKIYQNFKSVS